MQEGISLEDQKVLGKKKCELYLYYIIEANRKEMEEIEGSPENMKMRNGKIKKLMGEQNFFSRVPPGMMENE